MFLAGILLVGIVGALSPSDPLVPLTHDPLTRDGVTGLTQMNLEEAVDKKGAGWWSWAARDAHPVHGYASEAGKHHRKQPKKSLLGTAKKGKKHTAKRDIEDPHIIHKSPKKKSAKRVHHLATVDLDATKRQLKRQVKRQLLQHGKPKKGKKSVEKFAAESQRKESTSGGGWFSDLFGGSGKEEKPTKKKVPGSRYLTRDSPGAIDEYNTSITGEPMEADMSAGSATSAPEEEEDPAEEEPAAPGEEEQAASEDGEPAASEDGEAAASEDGEAAAPYDPGMDASALDEITKPGQRGAGSPLMRSVTVNSEGDLELGTSSDKNAGLLREKK